MTIQLEQTQDGHPAYRLNGMTYALVPGYQGVLAIGRDYQGRDPSELTAAAFSTLTHPGADTQAFIAEMESLILHDKQVAALNRVTLRDMISTPWGMSQHRIRYALGMESVSTAGHGGFLLDNQFNELVDPSLRSADGAYEEDCDWAIVAFSFPDYFTDREKACADRTLRSWRPDEYEQITGKTIQPGESFERDQARHLAANANRYIVTAASTSKTHPGMIHCIATIGGDRKKTGLAFLVPADEYKIGFGFVIDEARHARVPAAA